MNETHVDRMWYGIGGIAGTVLAMGIINAAYYVIILGGPESYEGPLVPLVFLIPAAIIFWPTVYGVGLLLEALGKNLEGWLN